MLRNLIWKYKGISDRITNLRIARKPHWHVVGDSHVDAFSFANARGLVDLPMMCTMIGGATAVGLRNPNSLTNAVKIFTNALLPFNDKKIPVIQLGEVDCGFVIWYRSKKYNESVDTQFKQSIAAYLEFVTHLRNAGYKTIVMTSATLPTILDGYQWGDVANARREVTATLRERTDMTLRYNECLKAAANAWGLPFIDVTGDILDPRTRLVSEEFRNPDPSNHHLDPAKFGPLLADALNQLEPQARNRHNLPHSGI